MPILGKIALSVIVDDPLGQTWKAFTTTYGGGLPVLELVVIQALPELGLH